MPTLKESSIEESIKSVIFEYLNKDDFKIFLFWSRARWDFRHNSDWDIWIYWEKPIDYRLYLKICRELENLPILINVVDFNRVDDNFRDLVFKKETIISWNN
jgi:predicted nucleotidyltransferase